jgi:hypothetical protein
MVERKELAGFKFNRLTVLSYYDNTKAGKARWLCECDCGRYSIAISSALISGTTKSCGCWNLEVQTEKAYKLWGSNIGRKHTPEWIRHNAVAISGENGSNWKGGITKENKLLHKGVEFQIWRRAVYERDNYICQDCGVRGGKLEPHHIYSFANYPELRFEVSNGITLCKSCHKKYRNRGTYE